MTRAVALSLAALLALLATTAAAHEGTEVSVRGEVRPNGPIEVIGEGFEANDHVRIELRKEGVKPIEIGRVPADGEGAFEAELHVPATVPPGIYQLAAEGEESATTAVTVLEPASGAPVTEPEPRPAEPVSNDRPAGEIVGLAAFTAAIAAAATALLWLSRTRARPVALSGMRAGSTTAAVEREAQS